MTQLPEDILDNVQRDIKLYENQLKKIALAVVSEKISKYPIFIAHRLHNIALGRLVIDAETMQSDWSINASVLEEFIQKKVISSDKIAEFSRIFKDPSQHLCLFVLVDAGTAGFAFYPYHG
jgi:hypothetical protein